MFEEVGERGGIANVLASKGILSFSQGDYAAARELLEESLKINRELDSKWDLAVCLEGLAAVTAAQGESVRAVWFISAAQALRESIGTPLPSFLQALHEFTITTVRTQLGEQAFDAAWEEGRAMTPEQVLFSLEPMPAPPPALPASSSATVAPLSPAGLTPREMEVLRLLAQGLTSAQIAEQLVIGQVTVNSQCALDLQQAGGDLQSGGDPLRAGTSLAVRLLPPSPTSSSPGFAWLTVPFSTPFMHSHLLIPSQSPPQN